jgi:glycosyltransferase involved in cell wall biosynthesis
MKRNPRVSIGLPVFNGENYLGAALNSLVSQDYEDFELIISDNASSDGTAAICQEFASKDRRIRYYRNETNIGASGNYNRVFNLARGEVFKWASHDDECHPALVRRCLETLDEAPASTVFVFTKTVVIDESGIPMFLSPDDISSRSPRAVTRLAKVLWSSFHGNSLWGLIRSDALRQTRLMGCIEADHVLLAELALLGSSIELPEALHRLRIHARCSWEITRIDRLITDSNYLRMISRAGRKRFEAEFSSSAVSGRFQSLLQSLTRTKPIENRHEVAQPGEETAAF